MIQFKDIPGFEGEYQATSTGQIWSLKTQKFLKQQLKGPDNKKYFYVCLCKNNQKSSHRVNRLIAETFLPNPKNLPCVNHKDCNKLNNNLENLEWCSYQDNNLYQDRTLKAVNTRKENGFCQKVQVFDKKTNEFKGEFNSVRDAIRFFNLQNNCSANISAVLNGKKKSAYGFIWKKVD